MIVIKLHPIVTSTTKTDSAIDYENPWLCEGSTFTSDDIGDFFGFVYCITNTNNGRKYIGRKYFYAFRTPKGKKRKQKQESDWKKYYGSCPELKDDLKIYGKEIFRREILSLHTTKGNCNYEETRQLFLNNVLVAHGKQLVLSFSNDEGYGSLLGSVIDYKFYNTPE